MMKRLALALAFFATTAAGPFSGAFTNGPSAGIDYFPIGVFYENPTNPAVGACGAGLTCTGTPNLSSAAEAMHMNMFVGFYGTSGGGTPYPENNLGGGNWSDNGEMAQLKLHNQIMFGNVIPSNQVNDQTTVGTTATQLLSVAARGGNTGVLAGYSLGDEPICGGTNGTFQIQLENYPAVISALGTLDPTRPTFINMGFPPVLIPAFAFAAGAPTPCNTIAKVKAVNYAAMTGVGAVSFDLYATSSVFYTNPAGILNGASNSNGSDFITVPMDLMWAQGLAVQNLRFISGSNAIGTYTQSGSNELGFSTNQNAMAVTMTIGSPTLTLTDTQYKFTSAYVGFGIVGKGIPAGARITAVTNATTATMSANAIETESTPVNAKVAAPVLVATTSGSNAIVAADTSANFNFALVGLQIVGAGIPAGATVATVTDQTHLTLSANATATAASVGVITGSEAYVINTTNGNGTITLTGGPTFTAPKWLNQPVFGPGIPDGAYIGSITDTTHAVLYIGVSVTSATATQTGSALVLPVVSLIGGCIQSINLCLPTGNEYRPTAEQVNNQAWMSVISGSNFLMYFCEDITSNTFCAGGSAGNAAAIAASVNLAYVNGNIQSLAPVLNSSTLGICQHRTMDISSGPPPTNAITIAGSCGNGILTLLSNTANMPGRAMVKSFGGVTYLFTQSDQRSPTVAGGSYTFTLAGLAGKTATVIYDSNQKYHPTYSAVRSSFVLNGSGAFTDVLGNHADYQVKIYAIQ